MDRFMRLAIRLAEKADPHPNPKVGAVVVKKGRAIGQGFHLKAGMPHAEIEAMEDARRGHGESACRGATLYVSLEPCSHRFKRTPPCTDAIIAAGIRKVVYGMRDPNPLVSGEAVLAKAGVKVEGPVAEKEAGAINKEYMRGSGQKPFVAIKMAMSADGKTATRTGDSKWISGPEERMFVQKLRNEYDAVMVGAGTVVKDDPRLTCRITGGRSPLRVIIDGRLSIPLESGVLRNPDGKTLVATSGRAPKSKVRKVACDSEAHVMVCGEVEVDLRYLAETLGGMGVRKILIEGGSELNAKALEAGIVDKLYLVVSPKIIGGKDAKGVIGGAGIARMAEALALKRTAVRKIGDDLLIEYSLKA